MTRGASSNDCLGALGAAPSTRRSASGPPPPRAGTPPRAWTRCAPTLARRFPDQAGDLLAALSDFGLTEARLDLRWRTQALSLAVSYEVAFYDAAYHAVALVHGGVFVTADERYVARAAPAGGVETLRQRRS